jgi:hypothetical protein
MPEDIFLEDKAALDNEGMPEDINLADKAKLDIEDIPKDEVKKKDMKGSKKEGPKSESELETDSKPNFIQSIITFTLPDNINSSDT